MKICGIYKITNTITGDFYIGSSNDVKRRWREHKWPSRWKKCPNNPMYLDMQKYGVDKFEFQVIAEVEAEQLKKIEQQFIETLNPKYNSQRANTGVGARKGRVAEYEKERYQKYRGEILEQQKQYYESHKQQKKQYYESNKEEIKQYKKQYYESNKEKILEQKNKYNNQLCFYNGETLTLHALSQRFSRAGIEHPTAEAKKYLLNK